MKQWQSEVGQELLSGVLCQKDLVSHDQTKQTENQFIKEELQAMKAQNRNRAPNPSVHGTTIAFGGGSKMSDGAGGQMPQNAPQKAYDFGSHVKPPVSTHAPTQDSNNSKTSSCHGGSPNVFGENTDVFGGGSGSGTPQVPKIAANFDHRNFANLPAYAPTQDQINTKNRVTKTESARAPVNFVNHTTTNLNGSGSHVNSGSVPMPTPLQWFLPNGMTDACPVITPNTYQNWCRGIKLWRISQVGASQTQLISKIATSLPLNIRMEVMTYLESTESNVESRSVDAV